MLQMKSKMNILKNSNLSNLNLFTISRRPLRGILDIRIFVLGILFLCCCCFAEENPFHKPTPIRDGFMLDGIDGKITTQGDKWFFNVYEPTTDGKGFLTSPAQILPSSMLEKLTNVATSQNNSFRIWGKLTTYNNKNYVYLSYFLQVVKVSKVDVNEPNALPQHKDMNESQIIPDEALALLKPTRVINLTELRRPMGVESDGILADRTGFLEKSKEGSYFGFDGMGRNIDLLQLPLLQCQILEQIEKEQKASAFPLRYKIFAIVTKYKNKNYLLLQRAAKMYAHGNLAR
jgi:hypothetical protein